MGLTYTPLEDITKIVDISREAFFKKQKYLAGLKNPNKEDKEFRSQLLKRFYYAIKDSSDEIEDALFQDFHRSPQESKSFEIIKLLNDILHMISNLDKWMKPETISDYSPPFMFGKTQVEKISMGSVLVIAPFNFPVLLALVPVAYAIAAGNTVVLKPSELTENCSILIEKIIERARFPVGYVSVVHGGVEETTKLVESGKFDKIFYTGSPKVGSIISQTAAKTLTPCVLELGGKSPTFITDKFNKNNIETAMKRIFFGAFGNSGQICVSPDYIVVHETLYEEVLKTAKLLLDEFWPDFSSETEYTHMINKVAYDKAQRKIKLTKGKKLSVKIANMQSDKLEESLCIPPTVVYDLGWSDIVMQEENFSPILPIVSYSNLDDVLDIIISKHDTPLVQYIFSDDNIEIERILKRLRSGDCIIGDTMIHVGIQDAPFGGIGNSGYGSYGGKWGFAAFTNERIVFNQPFWMDFLLSMRYPPFTPKKKALIENLTESEPWFNRRGNDDFILYRLPVISSVVNLLKKLF
ncbi:hypothetical protein TPHA_0G02875 [Tetrapisispora phaffii CBS 4417]|uniref:Aldehyde dehydrogenase n=1 Tax=Tetrapisispora phaffii (strain ATCC 24235 / CBS 4417 / NBRC 1672 / NRRL Y-8282 / UCD 70-5) TaxID=1071381 RepID=G8BW49_TETPH|nr:hypothetical protein TPHA_0G02875 [Tetrapisispora phaffii CBS 4417]CCE64127.1 hypothetical protein TPHA_0G02875 [Tetrapisispora phaffii CBS 4417]